jgi:hypothetical protein
LDGGAFLPTLPSQAPASIEASTRDIRSLFISQFRVSRGYEGSILYGQPPQGKCSRSTLPKNPNTKDYDEFMPQITALLGHKLPAVKVDFEVL